MMFVMDIESAVLIMFCWSGGSRASFVSLNLGEVLSKVW